MLSLLMLDRCWGYLCSILATFILMADIKPARYLPLKRSLFLLVVILLLRSDKCSGLLILLRIMANL